MNQPGSEPAERTPLVRPPITGRPNPRGTLHGLAASEDPGPAPDHAPGPAPDRGPLPGVGAHSVEPTRSVFLLRRVAVLLAALCLIAAGALAGSIIWESEPNLERQTLAAPTSTDSAAIATPADTTTTNPPAPPADLAATPDAESTLTVSDPLPARASRLIPQPPVRVLDTRADQPLGPTTSESIIVDDGRTAVALSVSVINPTERGSVLIDGSAGIVESPVNPGMSITDLLLIPLVGNEVTVRSTTGGHLVIDVVGTFEQSSASSSGRFLSGPPTEIARLVTETDGRETDLRFGAAVPAGEADAILVSITADVGAEGGMVRLGPSSAEGFDQMLMWGPATGESRTRRGLALVQPDDDWSTHLRYDGGSVLTAEVVGYFTNAAQESSTAGLYVPSGPRQLFEGLLQPEQPPTIGGVQPLAESALITVASPSGVPGSLGTYVVPAEDGSVTLRAAVSFEADVTLLGTFLGPG